MNISQRELEQKQMSLEYQNQKLKVFIVDVLPSECCKRENMEDRMLEMENLVLTYGGVVIIQHIQRRATPDYTTYIGSGKLEEIIEKMQESGASLLIFGNILKPYQIYNVNEKLRSIGAKAWDRMDLILKIFEKNAKTTEARLQIELAAIRHMGPRIFGMGMELSRQGGGSKLARGQGETNTEIMKRHLQTREEAIKSDLKKYTHVRQEHRKGRKRKGFFTIGIVGYTNAGKSSLLNLLTKKGVLAEDKLFATLGTSVGKMWIDMQNDDGKFQGQEVLLSDTIGFIRDLPPELIDAFSSTLEDSIESDVLLHVVDSSDAKIDEKIRVVDDILENIGATQSKIYVFNKTDAISQEKTIYLQERFADIKPIFISTYKKLGIDELKQRIMQKFF